MIPSLSIMVAAIGSVVILFVLTKSVQVFETGAGGGVKFFAPMTAASCILALIVVGLMAVDIVSGGLDVSNDLETIRRR